MDDVNRKTVCASALRDGLQVHATRHVHRARIGFVVGTDIAKRAPKEVVNAYVIKDLLEIVAILSAKEGYLSLVMAMDPAQQRTEPALVSKMTQKATGDNLIALSVLKTLLV